MDNKHEEDQDVVITYEAEAFYDEVRGLVVVFLFFVIMFTVAHLALRYFLSNPGPDQVKLDRTDRLVYQLVSGICTFVFTVVLTGYSLLPFSIAANELLWGFPDYQYYVQWIDTNLVKDLALLVNYGTKISCLLLPFAYFLLIAQGFNWYTNDLISRVLESFYMVLFSYILFFGTAWSFGTCLMNLHEIAFYQFDSPNHGLFSAHPISVFLHSLQTLSWPSLIGDYFPLLFVHAIESVQLMASFLGLILLFACMPVGFVGVIVHLSAHIMHSARNVSARPVVSKQRLTELYYDALCAEDDQKVLSSTSSSLGPPHWWDSLLILVHDRSDRIADHQHRLIALRSEMERIRHALAHPYLTAARTIIRPAGMLLLSGLFCALFHLAQSYVLINIIRLISDLLFGTVHTHPTMLHPNVDHTDGVIRGSSPSGSHFTLGHRPISMLGHFGAALQVGVVVWGGGRVVCTSLPVFSFRPNRRLFF